MHIFTWLNRKRWIIFGIAIFFIIAPPTIGTIVEPIYETRQGFSAGEESGHALVYRVTSDDLYYFWSLVYADSESLDETVCTERYGGHLIFHVGTWGTHKVGCAPGNDPTCHDGIWTNDAQFGCGMIDPPLWVKLLKPFI